jgi:hypothetical protein
VEMENGHLLEERQQLSVLTVLLDIIEVEE